MTAPSIFFQTRSTGYIGPVIAPRISITDPEPQVDFESPFAFNFPLEENSAVIKMGESDATAAINIPGLGTEHRFPSASVRDVSGSWP